MWLAEIRLERNALNCAPASSNMPERNAQNMSVTDSAKGPYTSWKSSQGSARIYRYLLKSHIRPVRIAPGSTDIARTFPFGRSQYTTKNMAMLATMANIFMTRNAAMRKTMWSREPNTASNQD